MQLDDLGRGLSALQQMARRGSLPAGAQGKVAAFLAAAQTEAARVTAACADARAAAAAMLAFFAEEDLPLGEFFGRLHDFASHFAP